MNLLAIACIIRRTSVRDASVHLLLLSRAFRQRRESAAGKIRENKRAGTLCCAPSRGPYRSLSPSGRGCGSPSRNRCRAYRGEFWSGPHRFVRDGCVPSGTINDTRKMTVQNSSSSVGPGINSKRHISTHHTHRPHLPHLPHFGPKKTIETTKRW